MTMKAECVIGIGVISPCTQHRNPSEGKVRSNFQLKRAPKGEEEAPSCLFSCIQLLHKGSTSENKNGPL